MKLRNKWKLGLIYLLMQVPNLVLAEYGNIESIYINMPQEQNFFLSPMQRLELMEYHKAGKTDSIRNVFGNWTCIDFLDLEHAHIKVSHAESTTFEMKLFISPKDSVLEIGIIETVCAPICSSVVKFYDDKWEIISSLKFKFRPSDFIDIKKVKSVGEVSEKEICELLQPIFINAEFHKQRNAIIFTNETIHTLDIDIQDKYAPYIISKEIDLGFKNKRLCKR